MDSKDFGDYLIRNSVNSAKNIHYIEDSPLQLPFDEIKLIGEGIFNKVYKVKVDKDYWIIKEGRYDLKFPLFRHAKIPLPRKGIALIFRWFRLNIMPSHKIAIEQFNEYALLCKYFGYFDIKTQHSVVKYDPSVIQTQRTIRSQLKKSIQQEDDFAEVILEAVKTFSNYHKIKEIVCDPNVNEFNFLPQEYLILSQTSSHRKSFKRFIKRKETYYIVQKMIEGEPIGRTSGSHLSNNKLLLERLIYFILLSIQLVYKEKKVIDSRPESILGNFNDWFSKTGNIFLNTSTSDVKFIDTRWFWSHRKGSLLEKSFGELMVSSTKWKLAEYIELYK